MTRRRRLRVCSRPGCPELVGAGITFAGCPLRLKPGVCPQQPIPWESSNRRAELPPDWEKRKRRVKRRDGNRCVICGSSDRLEVDHIDDPDDHSDENLQTLCHRHHMQKTQREAAAGRRRPAE